MVWTLIIVLITSPMMGSSRSQTTKVEGFTSEHACKEAGIVAAKELKSYSTRAITSCIQVKP